MQDMTLYMLSGATTLIALTILGMFGLRGWTQWLALRRFELEQAMGGGGGGSNIHDNGSVTTHKRIELADLRERVRKLEAIAAGVDL
jgi:hypothetical protein